MWNVPLGKAVNIYKIRFAWIHFKNQKPANQYSEVRKT